MSTSSSSDYDSSDYDSGEMDTEMSCLSKPSRGYNISSRIQDCVKEGKTIFRIDNELTNAEILSVISSLEEANFNVLLYHPSQTKIRKSPEEIKESKRVYREDYKTRPKTIAKVKMNKEDIEYKRKRQEYAKLEKVKERKKLFSTVVKNYLDGLNKGTIDSKRTSLAMYKAQHIPPVVREKKPKKPKVSNKRKAEESNETVETKKQRIIKDYYPDTPDVVKTISGFSKESSRPPHKITVQQ